MNVANARMACHSQQLRKHCASYFDWDNTDIAFSRIDTQIQSVLTLPSDYDWHLSYWDNNLDKQLNERLIPGIHTWTRYSPQHIQLLEKSDKKNIKIDICTRYDHFFDILSIQTSFPLTTPNLTQLLKIKGYLCAYATKIWKKNTDGIMLPLRKPLSSDDSKPDQKYQHPQSRVQFGNIRLTEKEMFTIRCILSHRQIKEIAGLQQCSVTAEKKRLLNIKEKLGCTGQSAANFFAQLKKHGITETCLDDFITFHLPVQI